MTADLSALRIKDEHMARVLEGREVLVEDGGMGTMLQARGLTAAGELPDLLNLAQGEAIVAIHRAYVEAGAEMITTNTFGANRLKLGGDVSVDEVYLAAAAHARAAGARYVAGDIGPTGALLEPLGTMTFDEAYDVFAEQVRAAVRAGCDLIAVETMTDLREAKAAVLAACDNADVPVFVTMTFGEDGRTFLGTPPAVAAAALSSLGAAAVGVNCSLGPDALAPIAREMARFSRCPLIVRPNAGLPRIVDGATVYDVGPEDFARAMEPVLAAGASVVGGCCGTTPDHIRRLSAIAAGRAAVPRAFERAFVVTSAQQAVVLPAGEPRIAVIGERINPTGKRRLREALATRDYDYAVGEAVAQEQAGADILDVNAGLPDIDEPEVLARLVETIQGVVPTPLQIDSSDPRAVEAAARVYAGKPLVNSVNGKAESLSTVLPIAKRYGCAIVGLTLDEDGIPATAEGRVRIAERIVAAAEEAGIPREDVTVDCLVMAAATNQDEVREILRAVSLVKERLGVRTVLGISNVSFGMPQRNLINATFLAAAFGCGLDMPILNPLAARYRDTVAAFRVLNGQDAGAAAFLGEYAGATDPYEGGFSAEAVGANAGAGAAAAADAARRAPRDPSAPAECPIAITEAFADAADLVRETVALVLSGRSAPMAAATNALLAAHDPLAVVNDVFVPALDVVGARYDSGAFFLPQLMAAAEAVKAGFDVVRGQVRDAAGDGPAPAVDEARAIVLATVEGDIHDIGKNIVKMLLENYGFPIIDLGRDVAPERVVEALRASGARLVGLSALMTTTVKAMERTIELVHRELPDVAVMVGGAVLTPEYARSIGADFYAKDAAESARIAARYFDEIVHS